MLWIRRKIKTVVILQGLSICVSRHPTGTQNWDKSTSHFWNRSYKLLSIIITTIIIIVALCLVAGSSSLWWWETACIVFWFADLKRLLHALNYSVPLWKILMLSQGMEIESGTCLLLTLGWVTHTLGHPTPALSLNLGLVLLQASPVLDKHPWAFAVN